jgi:hypothetical protein
VIVLSNHTRRKTVVNRYDITKTIKEHCVPSWTTYTLHDDIRSIKCQVNNFIFFKKLEYH